ncbi:hypothetical protein PRIPAC_76558 [Pristionchus pacificus]|uniref:Uncharacterized protein n=1 Tax=Pristionchus pacificus TaxID=54126 RepID=A0A2A6CFB9_PRIPA|nr:hypothetical protein PRIPAC_76558 [Pristionchus pacificus]|eukprot:PDM76816.1 hypothetical protein PRIPAC_42211 [Pristionchus pacificus]
MRCNRFTLSYFLDCLCRHDMRYFSTISYDWNFHVYDATGNSSIPDCHEWRIRCSYFDQPFPEMAIAYARTDKGMRTGHLVYPLVVTGKSLTVEGTT